jgi:PIN domain nuclease of toxin-antitoxin system
LIWWWTDNRDRLSKRIIEMLADRDNIVVMSVASSWEIVTKHRLRKLPELVDPLIFMPRMIERDAIEILPILQAHAVMAGDFPAPHGDPFDRMIAAQSIIEQLPLASIDERIDAFGCERMW